MEYWGNGTGGGCAPALHYSECNVQMDEANKHLWLDWSRRLQAIAQNGLNYARDPYDAERYAAVREIAAEMIAAASTAELPVVKELLGKESGHATPKVDVRGVVFRDQKLLLVRERSDGRWTIPGGWADIGESPSESVVRELREESGFETRCVRLLAVLDRSKHPHEPPFLFHIYKLFILCQIVGGSAVTDHETDQVAFFGENEIPELSINRVTLWQVKRMFEHFRNPHLPPDFD
jgi:ADP-ribose pyrophosphatase YjhB (NUDIX family)